MSLYHEAADVIESALKNGGSIKSLVFGKKTWKSDPKLLFALTTEASKWSEILSEVIEKSGLLKIEKQLSPAVALVLVHDLLLSKKGISLPAKHGLSAAVLRHKARLAAELTKIRLKHGSASIEALRASVDDLIKNGGDGAETGSPHPRWVRINTLRTTLSEQLASTFSKHSKTTRLSDVTKRGVTAKQIYLDDNVPNLVAIPADTDIVSIAAYKEGKLILQDKASCFPALLLQPDQLQGDCIDACAAPGNKTTHLASLMAADDAGTSASKPRKKILACERDAIRSLTLTKMVNLAGASDIVEIKTKQDFMRLDPRSKEFANVTGLLLDPSCSGSGIVGRDDVKLNIHLPDSSKDHGQATTGKKRKRGGPVQQKTTIDASPAAEEEEETPTQLQSGDRKLQVRLSALSTFQLRLLQHAMAFPAARRITYSTCSVHSEENEAVVIRALVSDIAVERGWKVLRREDQVEGLRKWEKRGDRDAVEELFNEMDGARAGLDLDTIAQACIRCEKGSEKGTMGFFVAGFARDVKPLEDEQDGNINNAASNGVTNQETDEDEWEGFSDEGK